MSEDDKRGYTVRDRRRFDADGTSRDQTPKADSNKGPRLHVRVDPPKQEPIEPEVEMPDELPGRGVAGERVDFGSFVLSIATNAMMSLQGGAPDDRIPGGRPNFAAAAQHIDILVMLQEKTRGNLEPEEAELLSSVLYDLRMNYVAIAQHFGLK